MALTVPETRKDWDNIRQTLQTSSPEDFPNVDPVSFNDFKQAVLQMPLEYIKWALLAVFPAAFFVITGPVLGIAEWGAAILFASAVWVLIAQVIAGKKIQNNQESILLMGKEIGFFK